MCGDVPQRPLRRARRRRGPTPLALGIAAALALGAAALAGCGGGSGSATTTTGAASRASTTSPAPPTTTGPNRVPGSATGQGSVPSHEQGARLSDEQAVRVAVEAALASRDPEQACGTYVTGRYLKKAYGGVQGCLRAQSPGSAARSLQSLSAEIRRKEATATAVPAGGPYDGERVTASLVLQGGAWKVDALHANVPVGP